MQVGDVDVISKDLLYLNQDNKLPEAADLQSLIKKSSLATLPYGIVSVLKLPGCCKSFEAIQRKVSIGCPVLDAFLQGGLLVQGINEISGESGSGKTQLCLQLSTSVQLKSSLGGLDGGVAYLSTEDAFPVKRLCQMIDCKSGAVGQSGRCLLDNVFVEHINDIDSLFHFLNIRMPVMIIQHNVKMIIIDSIAAIFRCDEDMADAKIKAVTLRSLGVLLHKVNREKGIAVICINQVSDDIDSENTKKPSLGLAWTNMVTTRIMLSKCDSNFLACAPIQQSALQTVHNRTQNQSIVIRKLEIVLSPNLPNSSINFFINSSGIQGLQ